MIINNSYRYEPLVNFNAPIIPNVGLGGILLDTPLSAIKDWLIFNFFSDNRDNISAEAFNGIYISYTISDVVLIIVNVISSKIERLGCKNGYGGTFLGVKPGSDVYELIYSRDTYIENGFILVRDNPGIEIDIPSNFEEIEDVRELPNFKIERIFVSDGTK